jgi:fluoride exporter
MVKVALIGLGAAAGALLRYYTTVWAAERFGSSFPLGTLIINVAGSFVLGCFMMLAAGRLAANPELRLLVATGFCGGLTTFSTFSFDTLALLDQGRYGAAAANLGASVALGLLAVLLGAALGRSIGG